MSTAEILSKFPGSPRPVQAELLTRIAEAWDTADVIAITAPVALGKTRVATTIARWASKRKGRGTKSPAKESKAVIITPSRILTKQYQADVPSAPILTAMDEYQCENSPSVSCKEKRSMEGNFCPGCPYMKSLKMAHISPYLVVNPYTFLAHKLRNVETIIVDEAHTLVGVLRSMAGKKIWRHDHAYPSTVRDTRTLLAWLRSYYGTETNRTLKSLREQLEGEAPERWLVTRELQPYRGQERECLLLAPVDVTEEAARFFGQTVKKIVLLSATLSMHELHDLRLKGKRVVRLEAASAIPPEQRPILKEYIGTASYKNQEAYVASLCSWLLTQAPAGKGFVHMPYGWAHALAKQDGGANSRLLFHEAHNKAQVLANWRKSNPEQELILIACGMEEGIDLKGLEFSWQAIAKITWPSLQDVAIKHLVETRGDWFTWQAVKHVVQASGRICRAPDDFGVTLILDEQLEFLLERGRPLFPKSFLEAVQ